MKFNKCIIKSCHEDIREFHGGECNDPSSHVLICTYIFKHFCRFVDYDLRFLWKMSKCGELGYYMRKKCH